MTDTISTEVPTIPDPFGIDGPEYSDRDREMFVLGVEFEATCRQVGEIVTFQRKSLGRTIHEANVDRLVAITEGFDLRTKVHHFGDGWCRFSVERPL